jgi:ribosome-binding factor A
VKRDFSRTDRVAQEVQKEIAVMLQRDFKDPRIGWVTVSSVEMSKDLAYGKVYVTFFEEDQEKISNAIEILNDAAGFFRMEIGKRIRLRITPEIKFFYDESLVTGMKMSQKVDAARRADKAKEQANADSASEQDEE